MADNDNKANNNKANNHLTEEEQRFDPSRRRFMKNTGIAIGGVAGGSLLGGLLTNQFTTKESTAPDSGESKNTPAEARMFFTRYEDFAVLEQATERIFPEDDNGPGAIKLGVPYFIDKQLAGSWGMNAEDYRLGPFLESKPDADLARQTRGELFINGLRKMNQLSNKRFGTSFDEAEENQQIEILKDFEDDEIDMKGVSSSGFFDLLRQSVLEGAYSDPLYGGNRNMEGWKMKEFPGPVPSYIDIIEEEDFIKMDPISLTDYQQKS
ncbi:gluconate 2-dehydrogenase subunit 3 family protein [Virgibacillus saliphilus]|uniref:gluconate 2-dehydrogenase subunit 3 family protein n=1 Tax=Virgibacillus saliphilus TaxID=2831674 RepID=UPI0028164DF8|nr:gluconate 2-dehydrogenase subunit 3 family protein [Virgibacillus sp. NKC19-3]